MQSRDGLSRAEAIAASDVEVITEERLSVSERLGPSKDFKPFRNEGRGYFARKRLTLILIAVALGLGFRVYRLGAASLAEDEVNKILAVRCYQQGQFAVNAEHPMLLKLLCLAALTGAQKWNSIGGGSAPHISDETAIRLPNAIFGALTVIPLFLLAEELLGFEVAALTALLWAFGLNAIWFNRIAKEDTLLVFFMMTAFWLYNRAKNLAESNVKGQELLYGLSGAAFGLMFASKYFPHYYGLLMLFYFLAGTDTRNNRPVASRMKIYHYAAMVLAFVVFDFALFLPETWRYLLNYINENLQTHHGYLVMGRLYPNDFSYTPGGPPWYFYWLYLLVKTPIPLLAAFALGLTEIFKRRRPDRGGRGYLFLRLMLFFWLIPMSLIGAKFLRYTLALMPFVYMTAAVGVVAISRWVLQAIRNGLSSSRDRRPALTHRRKNLAPNRSPAYERSRVLAAVALLLIFVAGPAATALGNLPFPSLYTNAIGGGRAGYFFPHDEFYDLGARKSIQFIAEHARPGASVASEIPATLEYYLDRFGRNDIHSVIISHPGTEADQDPPDFFVLIQPGRVYYENQTRIAEVQSRYLVAQQSVYGDVVTTRVYRTADQGTDASRPGRGNSSRSE